MSGQYRAGGFDALKPKTRIDAGHPRVLVPELAERLLQLKEADPDLSIRLIIKQAQQEGIASAHCRSYQTRSFHTLRASSLGRNA